MKDCNDIPTHYYQQFSGTCQSWSGTDSLERFELNCSRPGTFQRLKYLGWLDPNPITYNFNSDGFRDDNFDQQPAGLALGCSHTQGVGLYVDQCWPRQLQILLGQKIWNLGIGGAALDTCYRLLEYWVQKLNIKFVVCAVPDIARYEVFDANWSNILPTSSTTGLLAGYHKNYIAYKENSELNRRKNIRAMRNICDEHHIPVYFNFLETFGDARYARDLMHCGKDAHYKLAQEFFYQIKSD
jgi:hypothetical protein